MKRIWIFRQMRSCRRSSRPPMTRTASYCPYSYFAVALIDRTWTTLLADGYWLRIPPSGLAPHLLLLLFVRRWRKLRLRALYVRLLTSTSARPQNCALAGWYPNPLSGLGNGISKLFLRSATRHCRRWFEINMNCAWWWDSPTKTIQNEAKST